jgi:type III pantothenate kinase
MANLVIDVGNTLSKIAVFENNESVYVSKSAQLKDIDISGLIEKYKVNNLILSSVKALAEHKYEADYPQLNYLRFDHQTRLPIKNNYATPQTLGLDRLAAVIGAKDIFPSEPVLVIDAGTCITFDFIDEESVYEGGSISPGIKMRLKAMHQFTGKLPDVEFENDSVTDIFYGKNTKEAMQTGALNGMLFEIEGYLRYYSQKYSSLKIILCGGDASFFDTRLKNSIFAHQILLEPLLVLRGLNTVVNYQND